MCTRGWEWSLIKLGRIAPATGSLRFPSLENMDRSSINRTSCRMTVTVSCSMHILQARSWRWRSSFKERKAGQGSPCGRAEMSESNNTTVEICRKIWSSENRARAKPHPVNGDQGSRLHQYSTSRGSRSHLLCAWVLLTALVREKTSGKLQVLPMAWHNTESPSNCIS
jgi:hypothetical protein